MADLSYRIVDSPVGDIVIVGNSRGLIRITFAHVLCGPPETWWKLNPAHPVLQKAAHQLKEYFAGFRFHFHLPFHPQGTAFQRAVWNTLLNIPYGHTISYQELAQRVGNIRATRAVAQVCAHNPLPIIVPCHRIVRKNGTLGGYTGGQSIKHYLITMEKKFTNSPSP